MTEKIILIGASTGGIEAIKFILSKMPSDSPGIIIVQHMPEKFTKSFIHSLNFISEMKIKEAEHKDLIKRGQVLIAKEGLHCLVKRHGLNYYVETKDGPKVSMQKPSVDVLFRSGARYISLNAVAVILTGLGSDGAKGMLDLKRAGAKTIAQDENSSVIFGMPNEAIKLGAVDIVASLEDIPNLILSLASG